MFCSLLHFGGVILKKHFGQQIRILHWCADQAITNALASIELTAAQGRIMAFLAHREEPPCSRDIEEAFHLSHPTVSGLLGRLEKKGFLEFRSDPEDRRCKRIYISDRGHQCHALMHQTIEATEENMVIGFTQEEREQFSLLLERAIANMGGNPCHRKHKEETDS